MNDHSKNERSKLRIAAMCLTHCDRFRLLRLRDNEPDGPALIALATEMLDLFEQRLATKPSYQATENDVYSSSANQPVRSRKKIEKSVLGD